MTDLLVNNALEAQALEWIATQQQVMQQDLWALAEINSGSYNVAGVNKVADTLAQWSQRLGCELEFIDLPPQQVVDDLGQLNHKPLARALRLYKRPQAPTQVFLCAHMDTVFPIDHPFQSIVQLEDDIINGPGVADLKGGIVVMFKALEAFERSPLQAQLGWEILFNPDEEIGSPSSSKLFPEIAKRHHLGLIYEPSFADGNLAGARKGSGNFAVVTRGKAAHAGREHHLGRNAIRAMADFTCALDDLNGQEPGVTINPGFVQGGGAVNIVPDTCTMRFNIRIERSDQQAWCEAQINSIVANINTRDGLSIELHGGFGRQPKQLSPANQQLCELVQSCGKSLGLSLEFLPTGGCCDGNNLAAAGLPNIDTLGVQGGKIHSADEYMHLSSLTTRSQLSALILLRLAQSDDLAWLQRDDMKQTKVES
jgi:glutamate carboxypeptidase